MNKETHNSGFSKLSRSEKISLLSINSDSRELLQQALAQNIAIAEIIDELSENTISHFSLPFGITPPVLINDRNYYLPLVTEESSVVAAISKAAKFWAPLGGFKTQVLGTEKKGQVHFFWKGDKTLLFDKLDALKDFIQFRVNALTRQMKKRGGGISEINLVDKTDVLDYYYQLDASFETLDAFGANFINSCLEEMSKALNQFAACDLEMDAELLDVNMSILSNYTPNCRVVASVSCHVHDLNICGAKTGIKNLAKKMVDAVRIAQVDISRAVTHNKGIYNGVDSLALATGNDWRAIEASGHAYASRNGSYASLSSASIVNNIFTMELEIPLAVGTVGGVTNLHPMAKIAMEILEKPSAQELMQLMAVSGLAANFSAVFALTSTGIQKGHMKMHLSNMLRHLEATAEQKKQALLYFSDKTVSFSEVAQFIKQYYFANNPIENGTVQAKIS